MTEPHPEKVNPLIDVQEGINRYGASMPVASAPVGRDLVAELLARGVTPSPDAAIDLDDAHVWSPAVTGGIMAVVEACESAHLPFQVAYTHVEAGHTNVDRPMIVIMLAGP